MDQLHEYRVSAIMECMQNVQVKINFFSEGLVLTRYFLPGTLRA